MIVKRKAWMAAVLLMFTLSKAYPQTGNSIIFFYKPYTDSVENNFYTETTLKFNYDTQYANLKNADVAADLRRAIMLYDYRFIAISGVSYLWPGLDGYSVYKGEKSFGLLKQYEKILNKHKFKVIAGTSDAIYSSKSDLQGMAEEYAEKYNKMLLIKLGYTGPKTY